LVERCGTRHQKPHVLEFRQVAQPR
jgi:hypothetical protein